MLRVLDEQRRATGPRSGTPAWMHQSDCGTGVQPLVMRHGDLAKLETTVPSSEILGDSLPPGRYYFAVEVRLHALWMRPVLLAAGDAGLERR